MRFQSITYHVLYFIILCVTEPHRKLCKIVHMKTININFSIKLRHNKPIIVSRHYIAIRTYGSVFLRYENPTNSDLYLIKPSLKVDSEQPMV